MKKLLTTATCGVLGAGLAFTAISAAAPSDKKVPPSPANGTAAYKGKFTQSGPGTKVKIKATLKDGEARKVKALKFRSLPASCSVTGFQLTDGAWTFGNVRVNRDTRKFKVAARTHDPDTDITSRLRFKGKFSSSYKRVAGRAGSVLVYGPDTTIPPPETCTSAPAPYRAKR